MITWLIEMEKLAGDFYCDAADYFKKDKKLSKYLDSAAEDEAMHFHVMGSAKTQLDNVSIPPPMFTVSREMKHKLETPFILATEKLKNNSLSTEQLIDCIIETEFSEWNKVFLYVVNSLKKEIRQFYYSAAKIQHHMGRTVHFLESIPYGQKKAGELQLLERVFDENILVVEDDEILSDFMQTLLEEEGNVDVVYNGEDALKMMEEKYYKLIVSDIVMPIMDGMELYRRASAKFPGVQKKFLFISGLKSEEVDDFIEQNEITFLTKPALLEEITQNALKIMHEADYEN